MSNSPVYGSDPSPYNFQAALRRSVSQSPPQQRANDDYAAPTLDRLIHHAEKFGCDCVYETAQGCGFSDSELATLGVELKKIAAGHRRARRPDTWWKDAAPRYLPQVSREDEAQRLTEQSRVRTLQDESRKRSRRTKGVKEELLALLERHPLLMPAVLADRLNISEGRVRKLLAETARTSQHPHLSWLNQAVCRAQRSGHRAGGHSGAATR